MLAPRRLLSAVAAVNMVKETRRLLTDRDVVAIKRLLERAGSEHTLQGWVHFVAQQPKRSRGRPSINDDQWLRLAASVRKNGYAQSDKAAIESVAKWLVGKQELQATNLEAFVKRLERKIRGHGLVPFVTNHSELESLFRRLVKEE
jgi:hypothetical protein